MKNGIWWISMNASSSLTLLAHVIRKATLIERWDFEQMATGSKGDLVRMEKMRLRSHCGVAFSPLVGKF